MRINDVELVPERTTYKVDASGRIIIPSYMRQKFQIEIGDMMDYYTAYVDGEWFLCVKKHVEEPTEEE
jgi:bifunctional DNA-binding transcriptional regulator/antitoxin component of YhaV-PrlF toxin-antitoxin module